MKTICGREDCGNEARSAFANIDAYCSPGCATIDLIGRTVDDLNPAHSDTATVVAALVAAVGTRDNDCYRGASDTLSVEPAPPAPPTADLAELERIAVAAATHIDQAHQRRIAAGGLVNITGEPAPQRTRVWLDRVRGWVFR